ncbi:FAD-binding oxidoreductase [Agromyces intestinalis]|uniref:FAD-binding oxidoreductase n=1 Tax=Agromyces intestinalis TaxID=2592652 RepID=A0A5C1YIJ3_9MICO|nr:FAD-binding oxidoreductase [Agromyces intestinalis]QEO14867.1 FAD-binding oxidoreductase [Agromyces intestinalis]
MNTPVPAAAAPAAELSTPPSLRESLARLAARLDGRLSIPGDTGWEADRAAWNLAIDQRPAAVAVVASVADVVRVVETARDLGLAVVPQSTGHNAGPLVDRNDLADAILLRTHELRGVTVDTFARTARVEAGAQWGDVVAATAPHGLAALAGSSHDVGVVGYTLGGGFSWLARAHGLAANQVLAVELVTADGVLRRVDAEHDADLFWAVRGGGGDFGVVTALEFRVFEVAEVVAGTLFFPIERTEEVLQAWASWTQAVPVSVTSVGRVLRIPPLPDLPPFLSGQSYVVVEAAMLESVERADELLAPLRALGPVIDTVHPQPAAELLQLHMDPPGPTPGIGDGMMLRDLDAEDLAAAVRAFARAVGPDSGSALLSAEIRHLGGTVRPEAARARARALALPEPGATAGFEGGYLVYGVGIPTTVPGAVEGLIASVGRLLAQIEPWRAEVDYLNFAEHARHPERLFGDAIDRLRAIKRTVDPTGVIRSNHPVR